ncbi:MAG: hypothetical protein KKA19_01890 [Candidatus Margulisbacteria bacterium]|nr:hypothetical protein [Candidatus Margulisiibacteriota bacterium]
MSYRKIIKFEPEVPLSINDLRNHLRQYFQGQELTPHTYKIDTSKYGDISICFDKKEYVLKTKADYKLKNREQTVYVNLFNNKQYGWYYEVHNNEIGIFITNILRNRL